ncbi:metallothiol transferase [Anaerosolibacter carboniphilus]|uniref:Metallothiol transferase n=1 Tax=Anaerosolibacter carboniphilus TaxID=1417629 RepID=A0A841KP93_9FIRM|nr:metallothiol transferase FosB [Anaerosolibacter carboniphilus]MBB6215257.1 metallothiol transferase [Anaerosolibacter carboniphilus]
MNLKGINHITISVSDLEKSIMFYQEVFGAKLLVEGETLAYYDLNGLWLALNIEKEIPRCEIYQSYTHISFSIDDEDYEETFQRLKELGVDVTEGRPRYPEEGRSLYFRDPDGHLFEFHTKTREDRIAFYKENRKYLKFYDESK